MPETTCDSMKLIAQTWGKLLFRSGGKLCSKKTFWWLIWWIWKDSKASMETKTDLDTNIKITFGRDRNTTKNKQKDCFESSKDLG
eukprot:1393447-Ditylum_brightwellii.AAC.1